ncbi:hypothetical protein CASFOL_003783 [Castilleja foliolosa]|uniref:Pentatricopeptide repeat-containing protein n=1 Tax=Castilleja foliolosa TaxID=1961234 RepID=A0ABD3EIP4_9LAMI
MLAMKRAQILSISERLLSATAISRPPLPLPHLTSPPPLCNISPQFTSAGDDKISFFGTATDSPNLFLPMKSSGASNDENIDCYFKNSALIDAWKFAEVEKVGIMLCKCKTIKQLKQVHLRMLINCLRDDDNCSNYLADKFWSWDLGQGTMRQGLVMRDGSLFLDKECFLEALNCIALLLLKPIGHREEEKHGFEFLGDPSDYSRATGRGILHWVLKSESINTYASVYNGMRYQDNMSPDRFTLGFLFKSFASSNRLKSGKTMHGHVIKLGFVSDMFVMNSLLEFYFRFVKGRHQLRAVRKVFVQMPERDIASWNAMISGLLDSDLFSEALSVFNDMLLLADDRCKPDETTLINIISNKGIYLSPDLGKWLDAYIKENKLVLSLPLGNALLSMFVYYDDIGNAKVVFKSMSKKSTYTWNLMITLLVRNKFYKEALLLFDSMSCCSEEEGGYFVFHTILSTFEDDPSLVGDGKRLFRAIYKMMYVFGVKPKVYIFLILIRILTRVGWLEAAKIVAKIVEEISPFYFQMECSNLDEVKEMAVYDDSEYLPEDKVKGISLTEAQHAQETHPLLEDDDDDVYKVAESLSRQLLDLHDQMVRI